MAIQVEDVFGVGKKQVLSYYERPKVDGAFQDALKTDKQIIVYGSSKQGKTSLVNKHLPYEEHIVVSLTPSYSVVDIYNTILRTADVFLEQNRFESSNKDSTLNTAIKGEIGIPLLGKSEAGLESRISSGSSTQVQTSPMRFNIKLANDVAALLKKYGADRRFVILENFHYLDSEKQKQLAYDLRSFQELGIRFVILGVWREKNHLTQFNGDLTDRIIEVAVEPWTHEDFIQVIKTGEAQFNVHFSNEVVEKIVGNAFDSIGVVQELLQKTCQENNVLVKPASLVQILDMSFVEKAIKRKSEDYSLRHVQSLTSIAQGQKNTHHTKTGKSPLFLPNYTVRVFLGLPFDNLIAGVTEKQLEVEIKKIHHRPDGIKKADMTNLLDGFAELQVKKQIIPPIIDYDKASRTLRIVDSTLYFFLRNVDKDEVLRDLPDPT